MNFLNRTEIKQILLAGFCTCTHDLKHNSKSIKRKDPLSGCCEIAEVKSVFLRTNMAGLQPRKPCIELTVEDSHNVLCSRHFHPWQLD